MTSTNQSGAAEVKPQYWHSNDIVLHKYHGSVTVMETCIREMIERYSMLPTDCDEAEERICKDIVMRLRNTLVGASAPWTGQRLSL